MYILIKISNVKCLVPSISCAKVTAFRNCIQITWLGLCSYASGNPIKRSSLHVGVSRY